MPKTIKEKKDTTTMRSAFIRVHMKNNTKDGLIEYTLDDIQKKVDELADRYPGTHYAYALHNKDVDPLTNEPKAEHTHIVIEMRKGGNIRFKYLKEVFPYGDIENTKSINASVQYLLHLNDPKKTQYDKSIIRTNWNEAKLEDYLTTTDGEQPNNRKMVDDLIRKIDDGEIREYNRFQYIDSITLARNKALFENAFKNRSERIMTDFNRKLQVIFISGPAGCGKTTYAKMLAKNYGDGSYYVSSSSNDTLQDYKGQEVLILDDLRDDAFAFADFLKLLDNHTSSSIKSRFFNKTFLGSCIIITSTNYIYEWYANIQEDKQQFFRRVGAYIIMERDNVAFYEMKIRTDTAGQVSYVPEFAYKMPNPVLEMYRAEQKANGDCLQSLLSFSQKMVNNLEVSDEFRKKFNDAINETKEKMKKANC